jgi:hypothetical protein
MLASTQTAVSALEMIFFGEDDISILIFVKIFGVEIGIAEKFCHGKQI